MTVKWLLILYCIAFIMLIWHLVVSLSKFGILGVSFSGFHAIPYTYVLPSFGTAAYGATNYGPNGSGGKFHNNKVCFVP